MIKLCKVVCLTSSISFGTRHRCHYIILHADCKRQLFTKRQQQVPFVETMSFGQLWILTATYEHTGAVSIIVELLERMAWITPTHGAVFPAYESVNQTQTHAPSSSWTSTQGPMHPTGISYESTDSHPDFAVCMGSLQPDRPEP